MAAPIIIHSTDAGAPTLVGAYGGIIPFLDSFLVGTLGWVKSFSGINKAVYCPSVAEAKYYRFDHSGGDSRLVSIKCYETMSSVDDGVGLWHSGYIQVTTSAGQNANYIAVGDSFGFYLFTKIGLEGYDVAPRYHSYYFGEFFSIFPDAEWRSIASSLPVSSGTSLLRIAPDTFNFNETEAAKNITVNRLPSGEAATIGTQITAISNSSLPVGMPADSNYTMCIGASNLPSDYNYPYRGNLVMGTVAVGTKSGSASRVPIGLYPGAYHHIHANLAYQDKQIIVSEGVSYLCIPTAAGPNAITGNAPNGRYGGSVLIDTGVGYRP